MATDHCGQPLLLRSGSAAIAGESAMPLSRSGAGGVERGRRGSPSIALAATALYAERYRTGVVDGTLGKWSERVPVAELTSFEQDRRRCTVDGKYRSTGHFETHPNFARRLFLRTLRDAELREGTRYRVEGLVGNGAIGGPADSVERTVVAVAVEALSCAAPRAFGERVLVALRAEAPAENAAPGFAPLDVLAGIVGATRVVAALWFDAGPRSPAWRSTAARGGRARGPVPRRRPRPRAAANGPRSTPTD